MTNALRLAVKDLYLCFKLLVSGLAVGMFSMLPVIQRFSSVAFVMLMGIFSLLLAAQAMAIERKCNTVELLYTLPVTHSQVMLSKYLMYPLSIVIAGIGYGCGGLLTVLGVTGKLVGLLGLPAAVLPAFLPPGLHLCVILAGLALGAVLTAVIIPLSLAVKARQAVWWLAGMMMALMQVIRFILRFLQNAAREALVPATIGNILTAAAVVWVVSLSGLYASYRFSCRIMAKKRLHGKPPIE